MSFSRVGGLIFLEAYLGMRAAGGMFSPRERRDQP
jgi:hypothetical protein